MNEVAIPTCGQKICTCAIGDNACPFYSEKDGNRVCELLGVPLKQRTLDKLPSPALACPYLPLDTKIRMNEDGSEGHAVSEFQHKGETYRISLHFRWDEDYTHTKISEIHQAKRLQMISDLNKTEPTNEPK